MTHSRLYAALTLGTALILSFTACKTTEANYRSAYEIARAHQSREGDDLLQQARQPKATVVGADTLMMRTEYITPLGADSKPAPALYRRYNVVAAQFKQPFNANSLRDRLVAAGFADAFLARTRTGDLYVVAAATDDPDQASALLERLAATKDVVLRDPFPFVVRSANH